MLDQGGAAVGGPGARRVRLLQVGRVLGVSLAGGLPFRLELLARVQPAGGLLDLEGRLLLLERANVEHFGPARGRRASSVEGANAHAAGEELDRDASSRTLASLDWHLLVDRPPVLLLEALGVEGLRGRELRDVTRRLPRPVGVPGVLVGPLGGVEHVLRRDLDQLHLVAVNRAPAPLLGVAPFEHEVGVGARGGDHVRRLGRRQKAMDQDVHVERVRVRRAHLVDRRAHV